LKETQRPPASVSKDRFSNLIAIVFMPQASSAYAFVALSLANGIERTFLYLLLAIFFASFLQLISLDIFVRLSGRDATVENREERPILFAGAIISYLVGFFVLRSTGAPFIISALMFAYFVNTIFAAIITKYATKVSIHTWGITGPSVAIFYSFGVVGFVLILALGAVVGSTRVKLRVHSWTQVALAFVVSIPLTGLVIYVAPWLLPGVFGQ
jgi:hypothetical protein